MADLVMFTLRVSNHMHWFFVREQKLREIIGKLGFSFSLKKRRKQYNKNPNLFLANYNVVPFWNVCEH